MCAQVSAVAHTQYLTRCVCPPDQVDPHATAEGEADDEEHHKGGAMMVCQSPGRALRSLQFGRQHADAGQPPSIGAPAASARK